MYILAVLPGHPGLNFLPSQTPRTCVGFRVLFDVFPKILLNRTPAPELDTDTRTCVHVTLILGDL